MPAFGAKNAEYMRGRKDLDSHCHALPMFVACSALALIRSRSLVFCLLNNLQGTRALDKITTSGVVVGGVNM